MMCLGHRRISMFAKPLVVRPAESASPLDPDASLKSTGLFHPANLSTIPCR
jgi:hypothetical protein